MKASLYLLQFNNYYNRQLRKFPLLSNYEVYKCQGTLTQNPITEVNFIPNDGITTTQVINWDGTNPDYVLVCEGRNIISRWFVTESVRLLTGQYRLTLYRDTLADFYDNIIDAPMFVEKGYVNTYDPAIYNSENMSFNQIKQDETLLRDRTKSAWIVGYCATTTTGESVKYGGIPSVDFSVAEQSDWEYSGLVDKTKDLIRSSSYSLGFLTQLDDYQGNFSYAWVDFTQEESKGVTTAELTGMYSAISASAYDTSTLGYYRATAAAMNAAKVQSGYTDPGYKYGNITRLNGKKIKIGTGDNTKYYSIKVSHSTSTKTVEFNNTTNTGKELQSILKTGVKIGGYYRQIAELLVESNARYRMTYTIDKVGIELEEFNFSAGFTTTLRANRPQLNDAPYCMFAIPYSDTYKFRDSRGTHTINKTNSYSLAVGIATALGGIDGASKIYDLQLLPYCPVPLVRDYGTTINFNDPDLTDNIIYDILTDSDCLIFWAKDSSNSFNITYNYYMTDDPIRFKVKEQTTMMRLCSPNYNGVFEFNPYRNQGVSYINVDYTYKPHQPYIHLNPDFKGLYGMDYNDARGLICGGDFSLPIIDDAWIDYQISNKNYQEIFNRQISNMETQYSVAREQEKWGIASGTVSGGIGGATSAGMMSGGNPYAAIAGGVIGGTMSLLAGQKDRELSETLRQEALDYTKDMFGYQIGNIKALPDSLTRVSAYNANNKIFPFMERYGATAQEEKALEDKIKYNGMSIYRIGTLKQFLTYKPSRFDYGYYKGQIIRLEGLGDDSHVANVIAAEMNKGVFIE